MTAAHHIAGAYVSTNAVFLWPLIHGLFVGAFCNRRTRSVLNWAQLGFILLIVGLCVHAHF